MPEMHTLPDRELEGNAQLVKSALICVMKSALGFEHSCLSETT